MRQLFILILIAIGATQTFAAHPLQENWNHANAFYVAKQYDSAAICYERLLVNGKASDKKLYFNLGNAYYKLGRVAPAIINYKRALRIDPEYKEAKDNLMLAEFRIVNRVSIADEIFFVRWWHAWTKPQYAQTWAIVSILLFFVLLVMLWMRLVAKKSGMRGQVIVATVAMCMLSILIAWNAADNMIAHNEAVIIERDVPLLAAPGHAKPQAYLPEGTSVMIDEQRGGYVNVSLTDGRSGWILQTNLVRI